MNRPNIIYLHMHDTGRCVEPYGFGVSTPAMQRLASDGVLFRNAFSTCAICSPSRASLLTGQYPHACGMYGLDHRGKFVLDDYGKHLIHTLKAAGYTAISGGLQHIGHDVEAIGFDRLLGPSRGTRVAEVVPRVERFLDEAPKEPFFLDVGFFENHKRGSSFLAEPEEIDGRFHQPPAGLPDTPAIRREMGGYAVSLAETDRGVARVVAALERNGLLDRSLVILTTDHGLPVPGHKWYLTDRGTGVMLIMRGPGAFAGGKVVEAQVSQVDLFPTLCEVVGIEPPEWLQGVSLMPLLDGRAAVVRDEVFAEMTYHNCYVPMRSVRTERWKYIRRFDPDSPGSLSDDGAARDFWLENGWPSHLDDMEQLYDLKRDPLEVHNLAASPEHRAIVEVLRSKLRRWQEETGDGLLAGPVFPPSMEGITGYIPERPEKESGGDHGNTRN